DSGGTRFLQERIHPARDILHPPRGASTPMLVPHVANHQRGGRRGEFPLERYGLPHVAVLEWLHAAPQLRVKFTAIRPGTQASRNDDWRKQQENTHSYSATLPDYRPAVKRNVSA